MPTVIALDVSLSMRRPVSPKTSHDGGEILTRHQLAVHGINQLLNYLQANSKLEFVSLLIFSSTYEVLCPFTRDYDMIRSRLQSIEERDKTCIERALHGINTVIMSEWGITTACQVILITDGSPGVGPMSLGHSLNNMMHKHNSQFPLPFPYPAKLNIVCIKAGSLINELALYQRLIELASGDSALLLPENDQLSKSAISDLFKRLAECNYVSFQGYLKCGNLGSKILLSPPPMSYTKKSDFHTISGLTLSKNLEICGFMSVTDVGSPNSISRHLILPLPTEKNFSTQGISLEDESDVEDNTSAGDEGKSASFCVLLHGALKVENMAALCLLNTNWYGFIYSWADTKKKSNLMLTVLEPGCDIVPWLGNFNNLSTHELVEKSNIPGLEILTFPLKPHEKRSYSQNAPSWIRQVGLQSDIQKILRHARKLPEKTQNFYKELNRLRRAALSMGFVELLEGLASIFERECTLLPPNLHLDCTIQMGHVAEMLRKPYSRELKNNITPVRTQFHKGDQ